MNRLRCPYLQGIVELTEERYRHIRDQHPDLLPDHFEYLVRVVEDPDEVRIDPRFSGTSLFSRWFKELKDGKFVGVGVVSGIHAP